MPQPAAVPAEVDDADRPGLVAQRAALVTDKQALEQEIASQRGACGHVDTDDAARLQSCADWRGRLGIQYRAYMDRLKAFDAALLASTERGVTASLDELLGERRDEAAHMRKRIAVWQKSLRDVQASRDLQGALAEAAKASEEAQVEAISAATSYLMGPLSDAVKQAQLDGTLAWSNYQRVKPALESVQRQMVKYRRVWSKYPALKAQAEQLQTELDAAQSVLRSSDGVREAGSTVLGFGKRTMAMVALINVVQSPLERHDLLAAMAELQKTSLELLKNAGLDRTIEAAAARGMDDTVQAARAAKFVAKYSAAAAKFGLAWSQIDELNRAVDDRNRLGATFSFHIHQDVDRLNALEAEAKEIDAALAAPPAARRETLRVLQARASAAAYREGDWFSGSTGARAPGEPILSR